MAPLILTLTDMIDEVRTNVAEPNTGFYEDDEITRWLNIGIVDFVSRSRILTTDATTGSTAGQKKYGLPNDFMVMEKVFYNGREIRPVDMHRLLSITDVSGIDQQGDVELYYIRGAQDSPLCLFLWKVPSATIAGAIKLHYIQKPEAMTTGAPTFPLSSEWANAIILYASARAHRKQRQIQDARECMAEYEKIVANAEERRGGGHQIDEPQEIIPYEVWREPSWRRW